MNEALFIDASNLNALFMVNGSFCLGANYSTCLDKLVMDAQALGNSFNVYISLMPRLEEDGDVLLKSLTVGKVNFWATKLEINSILRIIEDIPGVNTVYLCNGLANFLYYARIENFQSVVCYGSRYAFVTAKERKPEILEVYKSQKAFYDVIPEDFSCYGDIDLIDVDAIRAQYPELSKFKKSNLVPIASLIASCNSLYHVSADVIKEEMDNYNQNVETDEEDIVEEKTSEQEDTVVFDEDTKPNKSASKNKRKNGSIDWVTAILVIVICLCALCIGVGYQCKDSSSIAQTYLDSLGSYEKDIEVRAMAREIYVNSVGRANVFASILSYSKESELEIGIVSLSGFNNRVVLQINCTSNDVKDEFVSYLERRYTVSEVNNYGSISNTDGTMTYEYGIILVP